VKVIGLSNYYIMEADVLSEVLSYFKCEATLDVIHKYDYEDEEFKGLIFAAVDLAHTRMMMVFVEKSSFTEYEYSPDMSRDYQVNCSSLGDIADAYSSNPLELGEIKLTEDLSMAGGDDELTVELSSCSITNEGLSFGISRCVNVDYNINEKFKNGRDTLMNMLNDDCVSAVVNADSFSSTVDYIGRLLDNEIDKSKVSDKSTIGYIVMGYMPSEYPDDVFLFTVEQENGLRNGFDGDVVLQIQLTDIDNPRERDISMKYNLDYLVDLVDTFDKPFKRNRKLKFFLDSDYPLVVEQDKPNNFDGYFITGIAPVVDEEDNMKNFEDLDTRDIYEE